MSYSFHIRAANKAEAKTAVACELDRVVAAQAEHALDRAQAEAAAAAFIDLLPESKADCDLRVSVNGSVSWVHDTQPRQFTSAGVGVAAGWVPLNLK